MQFISFSADRVRQLAPLFSADRPIPIRLWAILDGTIQGRMVVDEPNAPSLALVQELAEGWRGLTIMFRCTGVTNAPWPTRLGIA